MSALRRIGSFAAAGGAGFAVDAAMLLFLIGPGGLDPFLARCLSIAAAIATTWALNRRLTFGPSGRSVVSEGARYGGVAAAVALMNYCIYTGLLLALPGLPPLAALFAASGAAMAISFLGYSRLVFTAGR